MPETIQIQSTELFTITLVPFTGQFIATVNLGDGEITEYRDTDLMKLRERVERAASRVKESPKVRLSLPVIVGACSFNFRRAQVAAPRYMTLTGAHRGTGRLEIVDEKGKKLDARNELSGAPIILADTPENRKRYDDFRELATRFDEAVVALQRRDMMPNSEYRIEAEDYPAFAEQLREKHARSAGGGDTPARIEYR